MYKVPESVISEIFTSIHNINKYSNAIVYEDVIRLINKALSDENIGTILGADANIIRYSELRHIDDLDDF